MTLSIHALLCCALLAAPARSWQQEEEAQQAPHPTGAIAWYGSMEQGLAEARRLRLPILLQSAAPRCNGVPGMW
jgi:hypothetical protein